MARRELCDDLHRLLRLIEERHSLPHAIDTTPAMRLRAGLLATLRGLEDLHGFQQSIPPKRAKRAA
jgi:hypothetical protein